MAPHSSTLAWKIPWMEEPGRLQSMGSLRVRHDWVTSLALEKEMATHSSVLAWRIPGTGKPGGLLSMGRTVRHDWSNLAAAAVGQLVKNLPAKQETRVQFLSGKIPWRRKWQPTPVFLPGESNGKRNLAGCRLHAMWSQESDTTYWLNYHHHPYHI